MTKKVSKATNFGKYPEGIQKKITEVKPIEEELAEEKEVKTALKMESE